MPVNRITVLIWATITVLGVGTVIRSRFIIGLAFVLGGLAFFLLIGGAIRAHNEQRRELKDGDSSARDS